MKANKMKANIGIDIDCTVFDTITPILDYIGKFHGVKFKKEQIHEVNIEKSLNISKKLTMEAVDFAVENENLEIYKDAKEVIQWLAEHYNIYFITYRPFTVRKYTVKLLNTLDIDYHITYTKREFGKTSHIIGRKIGVFIEDEATTIRDIAKVTDCTCLVYDHPWNKRVLQNDKIIRVHNWKEIKDFFITREGV